MTQPTFTGLNPLHDLAGYRHDEVYFLPNGRIVTKESWDSPMLGWDFEGAVYLQTLDGIVDSQDFAFAYTLMGYKRLVDKTFSLSYVKRDSDLTQGEFEEVVERLRQNGFDPENFSLEGATFWMNKPTKVLDTPVEKEDNGEDNLHE